MRVLVVEDNLPIRKAVAKGLREAGFAVDVSGDGEEGLWFATSNDYDVVVLDLMLPGVDGLTILKRLRAEGRSTHVLILTARDTVLVSTARAISVSVERTDSGLRTDIDETEMPEFRRADRPEYFEVWRQDGPVLARSSSLRQADLERFEGVPGAFVFRSIRLPDGRPGRAAGLRFTPMADDEADYREAMAECLAIVRRTDALVTSLLTLARLEGGPGPLHRESIALGEAVRDALQPLQGRIAARRLAVESPPWPQDCSLAWASQRPGTASPRQPDSRSPERSRTRPAGCSPAPR